MSAALLTEQPPPTASTGDIWREVLADMQRLSPELRADMEARREQGIARYGTPLQMGNLRDSKADAYQEALDAVAYAHVRMRELDAIGDGKGVLVWRLIRRTAATLAEEIRVAP